MSRAQLAIEGAALELGESVRMVCPFCGGGSTNEKSLVLTHTDDGALLFICHRDHCGIRGSLGGVSGVRSLDVGVQPRNRLRPEPQSGVLALGLLDVEAPEQRDACMIAWHLKYVPSGWGWSRRLQRVAMPVLSPTSLVRGYVCRQLDPREPGPKTLNYKDVFDQPWLHWGYGSNARRVWIVEDIPSCERLFQVGETACALMGTYASADVLEEILAVAKGRPLIVALDKDAIKSSVTLMEELRLRHSGPVVASLLLKDIKNMNDKELNECLKSGC